jgi:CheY-like chemotaxis protein
LLDISKIESGQLPVHIEEVNLKDLFAELSSFFSEYQKRINKQHIHFSLNAFSIPGENLVLTDKVKLKQIFINLISNAFKFTDEGKIEGGCKFDQKRNLLFWVSDTGIGIPPDKHQFIFERFTQLHQGVKKNIGGTGLGLSIVKALVNLLGGNIYLESVPGKGCTFYFSIPYNPASIESTQPLADEIPKPVVFPDKTVMIVEDDPYNAEYLKEVLSNTGLNILLAETGKEAVSKLLEEAVDLVLMDIRLPDISGYEVAQVVREQKSNLRIIAQTAYATSDEHKKALNAGFVDYLSKPIRRDVLLSMLNKHLTN